MKRNLLKTLGITFLIYVVLSWLIPVGTYSNGELSTSSINPIGLGSLFNTPISALITFILYGVVFAVIGGFYGVARETGALDKVVVRMTNAYKGKESKFLVLTIVLFIVLSSLTGLVLPLFVLVPLFAAVLFALNYDKVTVLAATVGSLLVGSVVSTYGFNVTGYTKNLLSLNMNSQIISKLILLVLLTVLYVFTILLSSKKKNVKKVKAETKKAEVKEVRKETKNVSTKNSTSKKSTSTKKTANKSGKSSGKKGNTKALAVIENVKMVPSDSKKSATAFVVILILMLIVAFVGMYNWYYSFGIDLFNNIHQAIMGVKIKDFPIFEKLFGGISQFGYWSNIDFAALLIATSMLLAWVYKLSVNEYVESFIAGAKKWLPTAIYATLASVILVVLYQALQSGTGTLVDTIMAKVFGLASGFNPVITGVSALIGSFFFNDLYYLLADMTPFVTGYGIADISIAGLVIQSVHSAAMMIFPTSVVLIAGLSLFDVSYKDWIKYIWRFILISLLLVLLVCSIVTLL